jgi:hypothetical protein
MMLVELAVVKEIWPTEVLAVIFAVKVGVV